MSEFAMYLLAGAIGGTLAAVFGHISWLACVGGGLLIASLLFAVFTVGHWRENAKRIRSRLSTRERGLANVTEINSSAYAYFKEYKDLGAMYAFQVEPRTLYVMVGQDYYPTNRFPCLHFELITVQTVLFSIRPLSPKIPPTFEFDDKITRELCSIEDGTILEGDLAEVIQLIRARVA
jgi:hypothetical protein